MTKSLNLPYQVCYPLVRIARWVRPRRVIPKSQDQSVYFEQQYHSTRCYLKYFEGVSFQDRVVLDVGCGLGGRIPQWLELGASQVIGIDINRQEMEVGQALLEARFPQMAERVRFIHPEDLQEEACGDLAILFDSFEHLTDPAGVLEQIDHWLRPEGQIWIGSIGWYHRAASHVGSLIPIPWCQVLFSEHALLKTIQTVVHHPNHQPNVWDRIQGLDRWDHVKSLKDRPGESLNMLSLRQARAILQAAPFELQRFQVHGSTSRSLTARVFRWLSKIPGGDELFHSYYTALLQKPAFAHREARAEPSEARGS